MSANVFKCFGPIGQGMDKVGDASLIGNEEYPLLLTTEEFLSWMWQTKEVDAQCAASVTEGPNTAAFTGGVVNPTNATNRQDLIRAASWGVNIPITETPGVKEGNGRFDVFKTAGSFPLVPNDFCVLKDGTDWYPRIVVSGVLTAFDGIAQTLLQWDSRIDSVWSGAPPFTGNATILGKTITLGYNVQNLNGGSGTASFASPILNFSSDWPYT